MNRREFLTAAGTVGVAPMLGGRPVTGQALNAGQTDRAYWVSVMTRLADPVLNSLANGTLKARMPVEQAAGADRRRGHPPRGPRPPARWHGARGSSSPADDTRRGTAARPVRGPRAPRASRRPSIRRRPTS